MVTPTIIGGIVSAIVIATVASKEYINQSNIKRDRHNEMAYRRARKTRRRNK